MLLLVCHQGPTTYEFIENVLGGCAAFALFALFMYGLYKLSE